MVTAKTQYSLSNAQSYFAEHLVVGDYYQEGQKVAGEWFGIGAAVLRLTGQVREADFLELCENRHPDSGKCLTQRKNGLRVEVGGERANRRIFFDFTFSPPKSVSIAALIGGDERIAESHERAVRTALTEFEAFAATRIRKGSAHGHRLTKNVVAAMFTHDTSRALDPHLHTHCIVFNATHDPTEQRWKALQNYEMLRARKYVEAVYYHELAKELRRFGYAIRNRARGDFEIDGLSDELCARFAKRHDQIDEAHAMLLRQRPELAEVNQKDLREQLATAERSRKVRDVGTAELQRLWSAQMSAEEAKAVKTLRQTAITPAEPTTEFSPDSAVAWAEEHLFDRNAVVLEHEVWRQAMIRARGSAVTATDLKAATGQRGYVRDANQVPSVTTREVLVREWEIVRAGSEGVSAFAPLVYSPPVPPTTFGDEQRKALAALLTSRDLITLFRGGAGTGKSFVLKELADALRTAGHSVVTLAPQRQQVTELAANGFPSPTTLADCLTRKAIPASAIVLLDEGGQVGGKQMLQLIRLVQEARGRLILSGDTRQHGPVVASDAMLALERYGGLKATELKKIRRQNPKLGRNNAERHQIRQYRRAVKDAARGRLPESFAELDRLGAVVACPLGNQSDRLSEEYLRIAEEGHTLVVVAQTWNEVNRVNERVRARLRANGLLGETETAVEALEHVDLTNAQKRDARFYPQNAVVVFNQPVGSIPRGAKAKFITTTERGVLLDVERTWHTIQNRSLDRITVCQPRPIELAHGDQLQLKANRRMASGSTVSNGELVTVECVHADGRIALRDGRSLDPGYREFVPGYAVTSYGSQGKTVDYVLCSDSAVRTATNARQWYVTISRGKRGVRIYTPDKAALRENVLRSGNSPLALDLLRGVPAMKNAGSLLRRWTNAWGQRIADLLVRLHFRRNYNSTQTIHHGHQVA